MSVQCPFKKSSGETNGDCERMGNGWWKFVVKNMGQFKYGVNSEKGEPTYMYTCSCVDQQVIEHNVILGKLKGL